MKRSLFGSLAALCVGLFMAAVATAAPPPLDASQPVARAFTQADKAAVAAPSTDTMVAKKTKKKASKKAEVANEAIYASLDACSAAKPSPMPSPGKGGYGGGGKKKCVTAKHGPGDEDDAGTPPTS